MQTGEYIEIHQTPIPKSFVDIFRIPGKSLKLQASADEILQRWDICEAMLENLSVQALHIFNSGYCDEEKTLFSLWDAIITSESGLHRAEVRWIILAIAENLRWKMPQLPPED